MGYYQRHLFFCTNMRSSGKKCCAQANADEFRNYAKKKLKQLGLHGPSLFRVSGSGCLGRCDEGPILVVYPDAVFYSYKTYTDIDEIIEKHIIGGEVVERLRLADEAVPGEGNSP